MTRVRVAIFLVTALFLVVAGFFVTQWARGYRFDFGKFTFLPTGLLVATSIPDGAQLLVNGELRTATNTTINLAPGTYDIQIRRDGFLPWSKRLTITAEIVTKTDAVLFPAAPSLSALTFSGAASPLLSPDASKLAFVVPQTSETRDRAGLWLLELSELPLGFSREPRRITDGNLTSANFTWSPDSRQILLTTLQGTFLIESGTFTPQANLVNITGTRLTQISQDWDKEAKTRLASKLARLPQVLADFLKDNARQVTISADETKVLYTATDDFSLPRELIPPVPGASSQRQERAIKSGQTYVYDIKEDRNFEAGELGEGEAIRWFPTSRHLVLAQATKITIMDYDGTNRQTIWSGPYEAPHAYSFASATRLVILINLGAADALANLYSLLLR